ncbi:glutathione S-transferase N-terminal domain-containing protein [Acidiphilium sp. PA]|uniref:glutathione S-transferase family protein n=1 Tax=Acidiphilium sp. PA TaxID=2871705 RepID=UPI002243A9B7|nr:glutathione S-transferase N-terminal domain-containing protein [Acidiphilium sp. PA]MCW8307298.1 glutathione S-transferase N-terminal domain-containing protein [Acidiphilium sp. PA]
MKLYYAPGACSLGIHVILEEIGVPHTGQLVNLREGMQYQPAFKAVNPKSKVPVLELDDGTALTEWIAIAGYLAAMFPEAGLEPADRLERARAMSYISYINGTMHTQGFTRIFRPERFSPNPEEKEAVRAEGRRIFSEGFDLMEQALGEREWLLGSYSIADAALFYVSFWAEGRNTVPLPPGIAAHYARMKARPAVVRAMTQEGLI